MRRGRDGVQVNRHILFLAAMMTLAASLSGCFGGGIPDAKETGGRNPQVAEVPSQDETVRGEDDPPVVTLDLGSSLHDRRLSEGDELPATIIIPTTNLNAVPITAALQAVLAGTDVSLAWNADTLGDRLVTVMNLSGPLPGVVEKICAAARVFCSYRHGSLELQEKETFVVGLPPIAKAVSGSGGTTQQSGATNSMVETINQLISGKAQVDEQGGNIIYTTSVDGEERVKRYLEQLRNGRPLIVLQVYVWEVTLNRENGAGINWSSAKLKDLGPGFAKLALAGTSAFTSLNQQSGSMSLGAVTTGRLNTTSLLSFLSTQGTVQTVSNPQVTFVSGSGAELKIGGKQRYISQVGQLVNTNNTSGTSNNTTASIGTNTVSTDSIDTGLRITVNGAYESGVVLANLELELTNLVSLNPTASGGGTIDLPSTTDQKINTVIRVRPGDNLVMAGLVTSKDEKTRQGIPLGEEGRVPTYGDEQFENHELVIVVKPSVVLFSDANATADARKKAKEAPPMNAVLIDKDGSHAIAMPAAKASALPVQAEPSKPELMVAVPSAGAAPIPLAAMPARDASPDSAPVDGHLMQRGFSHAFDELLQPVTGPAMSKNEVRP